MRKYLYIILLFAAALSSVPTHAEVGEVWEEISTFPEYPFAGREGVALGEFQGKLWGTGGRSFGCACDPWPEDPCVCGFDYTYYDDLWVSENGGETWELVYEHAPFGARYLARMFFLMDLFI